MLTAIGFIALLLALVASYFSHGVGLFFAAIGGALLVASMSGSSDKRDDI